jgi:hypothetical protein
MYEETFGAPMLREAAAFFAAEGNRLVEQADAAAFLEHAERRLTQVAPFLVSPSAALWFFSFLLSFHFARTLEPPALGAPGRGASGALPGRQLAAAAAAVRRG